MRSPASEVGWIRRRMGGTGGLPWVGLAVAVAGTFFLGSILVTPGEWQWWLQAKAVHGNEVHGIVTYTYHGVAYTIDDLQSARSGPRTVYLVPSNPANGEATGHTENQIVDWSSTLGAYVAAGLFVAGGFVRKRRLDSKLAAARGDTPRETFGQGLDPDVMTQLLERQRRGM